MPCFHHNTHTHSISLSSKNRQSKIIGIEKNGIKVGWIVKFLCEKLSTDVIMVCVSAGPTYPVHLWQFILELLGDNLTRDIIAWTGNDLEFKVLNSRELARKWGKRKNKPRMNFDKLSRAMRYYYEKNIIQHIPGQRLVYTFCRNPDDVLFTELLKMALSTLPKEGRLSAPVCTDVTTDGCFAPSLINQNLTDKYSIKSQTVSDTLVNQSHY